MQILEQSCDSARCNLEYIDACVRVHGDRAPLYFDESTGRPGIILSSCTRCLRCVRACPLGAIRPTTSESTRVTAVAAEDHTVRMPHERPYDVSSDYHQFSERNHIFARAESDSSFAYFGHGAHSGGYQVIGLRLLGYSRAEFELVLSLWKIYNDRYLLSPSPPLAGDEVVPSRGRVYGDLGSLTRFMKRATRLFGADDVGITIIDPRWLYDSNRDGTPYAIPESVNRAIVFIVEMDYDAISTSPAMLSMAGTARGYSQIATIEILLSEFIRRLGYQAVPCGNDVVLSVPLAIDAGLGQYGRHGLLITKQFGPRVRIGKVLTDMPLFPDHPDYGFCEAVIRFCKVCLKCAEHCPSQAITYDRNRTWRGKSPSNNPGVKKWYVDVEACYAFWLENGGDCSNCIRSCPYSKPRGMFTTIMHRLVLWVIRHIPALNPLIIWFDDVLGYGRQRPSASAWKRWG